MARTAHYVLRTEDGRHVFRHDLREGSGSLVYRPGDELPEDVAAELEAPKTETKPVKKTTKPRRASTKE